MKKEIQRRINLFRTLAADNNQEIERYKNRGWDYGYYQGKVDAYILAAESLEKLLVEEVQE